MPPTQPRTRISRFDISLSPRRMMIPWSGGCASSGNADPPSFTRPALKAECAIREIVDMKDARRASWHRQTKAYILTTQPHHPTVFESSLT
jgi:hypothetical protein